MIAAVIYTCQPTATLVMNDNPYASPKAAAPDSALTYYQPITTKISLREYWRMSKGWGELILGVIFKFLRIRLPLSFAFADTRHFQRITPEQLSQRAREIIKPLADQALKLDLQYAFSYWLQTVGTIEGAAAAFLPKDGRCFLLIVYVRTWNNVTIDEKTVFAFVSCLTDGNVLATAGAKGDLDTPPHILGEALPGKSMRDVYERHVERLNVTTSQIVAANSAEQLDPLLRNYEEENFAFNVNRGVYAPVSDVEVARLQRLVLVTPDSPKPKPKKALQGVEMICWIALVVGLTLSMGDEPVNAAQAIFRFGALVVPLGGIAIIWLVRAVGRMRTTDNPQAPID